MSISLARCECETYHYHMKTATTKRTGRTVRRLEKKIYAVQAQLTAARKAGGDWHEPHVARLMAEIDALCVQHQAVVR